MVQKFDEHSVAKQHKFGVIYQKFGQVCHVFVSVHTILKHVMMCNMFVIIADY